MFIVTLKYIHKNVRYYDIEAAGPSIVNLLYGINILDKEKPIRNIEYGNLMRQHDEFKVVPKMLYSLSRFLCKEYNGIIYTQDSILVSRSIEQMDLLKQLNLNFRQKWFANLLIINKTYDTYLVLTDDNKVIIKGKNKYKISGNIAKKLLISVMESSDWLSKFKWWFNHLKNPEYFIIDDRFIITKQGIVESDKLSVLRTHIPNKMEYWKNLLQFIYPIGLELDLQNKE